MKRKYYTVAPRATLVKYPAWEFGIPGALAHLQECVRIGGLYVAPDTLFGAGALKCNATSLANRINEVVAYTDGRLGKPLGGNVARVVSA